MLKTNILLLLIAYFLLSCYQPVHSVNSKHYLYKQGTNEIIIGYQLCLPSYYNQSEEKFPLILFLHGANLRGDDPDKVLEYGLPKLLEDGKQLPFIIVSPQCALNSVWSISKLDILLKDIITNYKVDTSRIYVTGFSMGGAGTWGLALRYPDRFAAIAPVSGWEDTTYAGILKDLPIWVFHGEKDDVIPCSASDNLVKKISAAGGNIKFTKYPGFGHNIWYQVYNNDELYEWFLQQKR